MQGIPNFIKLYTVESRYDEHLYNEILSVPNYILCPGIREICVTGLKNLDTAKLRCIYIFQPLGPSLYLSRFHC